MRISANACDIHIESKTNFACLKPNIGCRSKNGKK